VQVVVSLGANVKAMADVKCKFCNDTGEIVIAPHTVWKAKHLSITTGPKPMKSFCAHCELGRKKHSEWCLSQPKPQ
jgi:hypothetical protein